MTVAADAFIDDCARRITAAFEGYNAAFREITRRAPVRFENCDWAASQRDIVERIELYDRWVNATVNDLRQALGESAQDRQLWSQIRDRFSNRLIGTVDAAFVRTFFSSVSRRLFGTRGVDTDLEFAAVDLDPLADAEQAAELQHYVNRGDLSLLIEDLLGELPLRCRWIDFDRSVRHTTSDIAEVLRNGRFGEADQCVRQIEVLRPLFFQSTRAYLVGRIQLAEGYLPLLIALQNTERGMLVDAVMLDESDVSIVFGFTRTYFHVDLERVVETVVFLRKILPRKPLSELFTVLGRAKQGKTERYRELMSHLARSDDQFMHAPGERGLVMVCFTLPSLDLVFKIIRDQFPPVKNVVRQDVLDKYKFVFQHDRAGRLVDAQEFKRLRLPLDRFAPALLEELQTETAATVHVDGDDLIFDHVYIERRITPLNLYLREAPVDLAEKAALDYGQAIRDLACSNIFAGDLLLKNFGVTRHGRVIFYDYDELCRVTDCRFREVPVADNDEDDMRAEAWFYVADNDVFPETFVNFLAFDDLQRAAFMRTHGDLLTADFWRSIQQRTKAGEVLEVLPYQPRRIRAAGSIVP